MQVPTLHTYEENIAALAKTVNELAEANLNVVSGSGGVLGPSTQAQVLLRVRLFLLIWLCIPSGFLVVFEKPNRSSSPSLIVCWSVVDHAWDCCIVPALPQHIRPSRSPSQASPSHPSYLQVFFGFSRMAEFSCCYSVAFDRPKGTYHLHPPSPIHPSWPAEGLCVRHLV